jgi:ribosomal protein S25
MAYKTGIATKALAERYGINVKSVRKVLKVLREHGGNAGQTKVPRRRQPPLL